jgi:hypothetical protein
MKGLEEIYGVRVWVFDYRVAGRIQGPLFVVKVVPSDLLWVSHAVAAGGKVFVCGNMLFLTFALVERL